MMGSNDKPQDELFYAFNLDEIVPQDHLLRDIDRLLDFTELREHLAPYYSHTGRPSVDPELMIRMLLIGYCCGIRSERQLCYEVTMNLAYRWFCKLSITDKVPDHSTFSKNRHGRFREAEAFRFVFEQVLQRCMDEGLIGGEGFAVDASVVKADASRQKHHDDDDDWGNGSRAINEYLDALTEDGSSIQKPKKISRPIRRPAGHVLRAARRITHTPPIIWWTPKLALSWMSKRHRHFEHRRSGPPRR